MITSKQRDLDLLGKAWRKDKLEHITVFVRDRTDAPDNLKLKSLDRLSDEDLEILSAAIDNC